jgi:glucosamine 6-phosphate synthetase-like amidotransferase/phosphosugar isomerase protein
MKKKPLNKSIQATVNNLIRSMNEYWVKHNKNPSRLLDFFENDIQFLYIVSKGASIGSAYEAAACAKSFARLIAEGISLGLFFHGTFQIADDKFRSVFIINDDLTDDENNLVNRLIKQITEKSGLMLLISNNEDLTNSLTDDSHVLPIKFKCDIPSLTPIFEMYVLHLLLVEVSKKKDLIF